VYACVSLLSLLGNGTVNMTTFTCNNRSSVGRLCLLDISSESRFLFGRWSVRNWAGNSPILSEVFRGIIQSFQANCCAVPRYGHAFFLYNPYQFFIYKPFLTFDAIHCELLRATQNKQNQAAHYHMLGLQVRSFACDLTFCWLRRGEISTC
jgi:hypothetical protein